MNIEREKKLNPWLERDLPLSFAPYIPGKTKFYLIIISINNREREERVRETKPINRISSLSVCLWIPLSRPMIHRTTEYQQN